MIWIDFTLIGLVVICLIGGLLRGAAKELYALVFWVFSVWVGLRFCPEFLPILETKIAHAPLTMLASFAALVAITLSFGGLIGVLLSVCFKNTGLTFMARFGGMVFGIIRGMVVVTVVVIMAGFTALPKDSWWIESKLIPPFQLLALLLRDHISSGSAEYISYRVPLH